ISREDALAVRVVARPLAIVKGAAEFQLSRDAIALHGLRPEDLGHTSFGLAPPHFHLPQPVLRHDVALRHEQVVDVARVDARHDTCVTHNLALRGPAGYGELNIDLCPRSPGKC